MEPKKRPLKQILWILLGLIATAVLIVPLLLPLPIGQATSRQFAEKDSRFIQIGHVKIHYKLYGKGEPYFILLHGTLMTTHTWQKIVGPLSKMGTVIAYDRPAFGLTSRPLPGEWSKISPYGYQYQVTLLLRLLDSLHIKQAVLIGNSMGGAIAAMAAQQCPRRIKALVLVDSVQSRHGIPIWLSAVAATPQLRRLGPLFLHANIASFGKYLYRLSWHDPSRIKPQDMREYFKIFTIRNFDRGLWELIIAARPFEDLVKPGKITVPTLLVTGDDDRIAGVKRIADGTRDNIKMAAAIPGARLSVIPKCGHLPQEECPELLMKELTRFFNSLQLIKN